HVLRLLSHHSSSPHPHLPSFPTRRSSDLLLGHTRRIIRLGEEDLVAATPDGVRVIDYSGKTQQREAEDIEWDLSAAEKEGYPHRSEEHTSELQSLRHLVCRLLLEKKKKKK